MSKPMSTMTLFIIVMLDGRELQWKKLSGGGRIQIWSFDLLDVLTIKLLKMCIWNLRGLITINCLFKRKEI